MGSQPFCHRKAKANPFRDRSVKIYNTLIKLNSFRPNRLGTKLAEYPQLSPDEGHNLPTLKGGDIL